ncbi:hypothetical protein MLD38_040780 [Melastoma candidum]|nr:hypothetical protein MLD38_040780 [Melastoma candidum]
MNLVKNMITEVPGQCNGRNITFPRLERLSFSSCKLTKFPSFLSQSTGLQYLDLSNNMIQEGIPRWFWGIGIETLEVLDLHNNLIGGSMQIPWKKLDELNLANNSFRGSLPIPPIPATSFSASQNGFHGSISPSVCLLTSLTKLEVAENNLTGTIPECLGNLTRLIGLDLSDNLLTGSLPQSLANCTSLQRLYLSNNMFDDTSPQWILGILLYSLQLRNNNFSGQWPRDTAISRSLKFIDLSRNSFEGPPPIPSDTAAYYVISGNKFSGDISPLMCSATHLTFLDMSNNRLTGNLPRCLENIRTALTCFSVRRNKLSGVIPAGMFPKGNPLRTLDLSQNQFEGPLPRSLENCKKLEVLDVGGNKIVDFFPYWLESLPKLQVFSIRFNKFYGQVNYSRKAPALNKLRILDLSSNNFHGPFPDNLITKLVAMTQVDKEQRGVRYIGDSSGLYSVQLNWKGVETQLVKILVEFTGLDLSKNSFYGEIPRNIGALTALKGLNLSHNHLTGTIPLTIGNISGLEWLDLSSNELGGAIPRELTELTSLAILNLSYNKLTGRIPTGEQFNTFAPGSFEGNPGLCGFPLPKVCDAGKSPPPRPSSKHEESGGWRQGRWIDWKATAAIGYVCGTIAGIYLGYVVLVDGRPLWLAVTVDRIEARLQQITNRRTQQ